MNIIELAKQAGINSPDGFKLTINHMATFQLEKFADLVAAAARANEREECAKLFDNQNIWDEEVSQTIRARGTT